MGEEMDCLTTKLLSKQLLKMEAIPRQLTRKGYGGTSCKQGKTMCVTVSPSHGVSSETKVMGI